MPTELDLAINATITRLMENDGPLTVTYVEKFGVQMPMLSKAPGNLADYFAYFCATNADKEFLVDGNCRLTFAQCYAAARQLAGGLVEGRSVQKGDRIGIAARNSANCTTTGSAPACRSASETSLWRFVPGAARTTAEGFMRRARPRPDTARRW